MPATRRSKAPRTLRIALAQLNPTVGDLEGNREKAIRATAKSLKAGAELVVFPELFLTGYPPEDLVLKPRLQERLPALVEQVARRFARDPVTIVLPTLWRKRGRLYNAALLLRDGRIAGEVFKRELPNYGVFDEARVFAKGGPAAPIRVAGRHWGAMVCEDMWFPGVTRALRAKGAEWLIVPNGSPFDQHKQGERQALARERVAESGLPLVYVNTVGGQDELVFDGGSFVLNADGSAALQLPRWREQVAVSEWEKTGSGWRCLPGARARPEVPSEAVYNALVLGLRDYVGKNGFPGVVIGLSGGVDSALSATVAVDALGPGRVWGVIMPSRFTSEESLRDARGCARRLGLRLERVGIQDAMEAYEAGLRPVFKGAPRDVTEENLQARIRGQILMAISNKFGPMVLTTGNKSELAVGYATLYGDMCGGYSVLKDVYKMKVYELAAWRNKHRPRGALGQRGEVIPPNILKKAPTAELRENQRDSDSLPDYAQLDGILEGLVEREDGVEALIAAGHDPQVVLRVQNLLYNAEYKRRQSPPGVKITTKSFGRERRYPITNRYRDTWS